MRYLRGVFPYGMQSLGGLLGRLEELAVFGLPDDHFERQLAELADPRPSGSSASRASISTPRKRW